MSNPKLSSTNVPVNVVRPRILIGLLTGPQPILAETKTGAVPEGPRRDTRSGDRDD